MQCVKTRAFEDCVQNGAITVECMHTLPRLEPFHHIDHDGKEFGRAAFLIDAPGNVANKGITTLDAIPLLCRKGTETLETYLGRRGYLFRNLAGYC